MSSLEAEMTTPVLSLLIDQHDVSLSLNYTPTLEGIEFVLKTL